MLLLAFAAVGPGAVHSQQADSIRARALRDFHGPDQSGKDGPLAKAGLDLLLLYHATVARAGTTATDDAPPAHADSSMYVQDGRVAIDAVADSSVAALHADLKTLGLTEAASFGQVVSGRFPIAKIPELATLSSLRTVRPARARTRSQNGHARTRPGTVAAPLSSSQAAGPAAAPADSSARAPASSQSTGPRWGLLLGLGGVAAAALGWALAAL